MVAALTQLRDRLTEAGWRRSTRDRLIALLGLLWYVPVLLLGLIRLPDAGGGGFDGFTDQL